MTLKTKILTIAFFTISSVSFAQQSNCKDLKACERKLCELDIKLTTAKKSGNQNQIKGIKDAISETKKNCTTKKVNTNLDKKVKEKKLEVKERTEELNEAIKEKESNEKIDKKRKKLNEAKAELNDALKAQKTK